MARILTALAFTSALLTIQPALAGEKVLASGTFVGDSNHATTGSVQIVRDDGRIIIRLGADFTFDGAPDPKVALGNDGYAKESLLEPLRTNTGRQDYVLKPGLDIADYNEVWIWCEQYAVPLGHAKLGVK